MNIPLPAGTPPPEQPAVLEPGFEASAQAFWDKYRSLILVGCVLVLLAIVGREGWDYYSAQQEQGVRADYARAADRPEQLATFAQTHAGHALAAVAWLRIADQRYVAADYRAASENYTKAVAGLQNPALLGRARLGAAMSQLFNGDQTAAETALKAIGSDTSLMKGQRAEATFHLATLAKEAGNTAEVDRLVAELGKIDPASIWSQRATSLLVSKPVL